MRTIYIIFNNESFRPVFVGASTDDAINEYKDIFSKAMQKKQDKLSKWVNEQWKNGFEMLFHELQFDLDDKEVKHYLKHWKNQFSDLLVGNLADKTTKEGEQIILGLKDFYG
ncbi:hypothetical protein OAS93_02640 [Gammaproteobacteria bacterium]|nr:hypothetical protein [Gammaproteobacteria bacterium]